MNDAQIKHMVDRFLGWKLPTNFNPDNGINFDPIANKGYQFESRREPVGTNLFDAEQAEAMVRYIIEGLPRASSPTDKELLAQSARDGNCEWSFKNGTVTVEVALNAISRARSASVRDAEVGWSKTAITKAMDHLYSDAIDHAVTSYCVVGKISEAKGEDRVREQLKAAIKGFLEEIPKSDLVRLARPPAPNGNGTTVGAQPVAQLHSTPPAHGEGELRALIGNVIAWVMANGVPEGRLDAIVDEIITHPTIRALSHAPSPPQQDGSELVEAAKALKDDLEARAVFDHRLGVKTVAASWSVWKRFTDEIMLAEQSALASTPKANEGGAS